jgi:hypothetical protein
MSTGRQILAFPEKKIMRLCISVDKSQRKQQTEESSDIHAQEADWSDRESVGHHYI